MIVCVWRFLFHRSSDLSSSYFVSLPLTRVRADSSSLYRPAAFGGTSPRKFIPYFYISFVGCVRFCLHLGLRDFIVSESMNSGDKLRTSRQLKEFYKDVSFKVIE